MATVLSEQRAPAQDLAGILYERYATQIYRFCLGRLRSVEEAEDAVQSTFLRAHNALRKGVVPELESAWLFKIAHNVCLSRALARSRRARVEYTDDLDNLHERIPAAEGRRDELFGLDQALADMPANLRQPLLLREWQGLSYAEIAENLGVSNSAVETLIFRARRHLARALETTAAPFRRALEALNLGPVLGFVRWLFGAGSGKVAAVAAVASVGTFATVGTTTIDRRVQREATPLPVGIAPWLDGGSPALAAGQGATRTTSPFAPGSLRLASASAPASRSVRGRSLGTPLPALMLVTQAPAAQPVRTRVDAGSPGKVALPGSGSAQTPSTSAPNPGPSQSSPSGVTPNTLPTTPALPTSPKLPATGSTGTPTLPSAPLPTATDPQVPAVPEVPPLPSPSTPTVPPAPTLPPPPELPPAPPLPVSPPPVPSVPEPPPLPPPPEVPPLPPPLP